MHTLPTEVPVKGRAAPARAFTLGAHTLISTGSWLKTARIFDEDWIETGPCVDPATYVDAIRRHHLAADLFTFGQPFPDTTPRQPYQHEWQVLAVAPTHNFQAWWEALPQETRKNVRKCQKRGVTIRPAALDEKLVAQIKEIYDESPFRQGRRFWHYGKDLATVRRENSTYLDRSLFLGAYLRDELIGFIKLVFIGSTARMMQILSKNAYYDLHPMNALIAAAVEACATRGTSHLIYAQYFYGTKRNSSVTEFKRRNGFRPVPTPRYFVPLTLKGRLALAGRLHRPLIDLVPERLLNLLLDARRVGYHWSGSGAHPKPTSTG